MVHIIINLFVFIILLYNEGPSGIILYIWFLFIYLIIYIMKNKNKINNEVKHKINMNKVDNKIINTTRIIPTSPIQNTAPVKTTYFYKQRRFMSVSEMFFYNKIAVLNEYYNVIPQINLATIVKKYPNSRYISELFRNIDFAIFTKDYSRLLLLIELNDKTHNYGYRKMRDEKVYKICKSANINLINFKASDINDKDEVIKKILYEINNVLDTDFKYDDEPY